MTQHSTTDEICFELDFNKDGYLSENPPKVIDELTPYFKLYNPDYWLPTLTICFDVDVSYSPAYWSDVTGGSPEEYDDERTVTHAELMLQNWMISDGPANPGFEHVHKWSLSKHARSHENRIIYALQDAFAKTIQEAEVRFPEPDDKYATDPRV